MKKLFLLVTFFSFPIIFFAEKNNSKIFYEIYNGFTFSSSKSKIQKSNTTGFESFAQSEISDTFGIKAKFAGSEWRYFSGIEKNTLSALSSISSFSDYLSFRQKEKYSIQFDFLAFSKNQKIPLVINLGSLSFSGNISMLKNPSFALFASPFSQFSSTSNCIQISLPSQSTGAKADAISASYTIFPTVRLESFILGKTLIQVAKDKNENKMFCINTGFVFWNIVKTNFSFTHMSFILSPKTNDTWFSKNRFFSSESYSSSLFTIETSIPFYRSKLTVASLQNPFGTARFFLRSENLFKLNLFSCGISLFVSDLVFFPLKGFILLPEGKSEANGFQLRFTPQLFFPLRNKNFFRLGMSLSVNSKLEESYTDVNFLHTARFGFATEYSSPKRAIGFSVKVSEIQISPTDLFFEIDKKAIVENPPQITSSLSYSRTFQKIKFSLTPSFIFTPNEIESKIKTEEKIRAAINFSFLPLSQISIAASASQSNGKNTYTAKLDFGFGKTFKNVKLNGKVSLLSSF